MSAPPPFVRLRQLARESSPQERCDLCGVAVASKHRHLIDPGSRQISCVCDACAVLFGGRAEQRYKVVPAEVRPMPDFEMPDELWDRLSIPVNMAFFFDSSQAKKVVAMYPSPAGATESLLELEDWSELVELNPPLRGMRPDVEALLVYRVGAYRDYFLAPIDRCYELVGLIRAGWRGLSGGTEVWKEIGSFFERLRSDA